MLYGTDASTFKHVNVENIDIEDHDKKAERFINSTKVLSEEQLLQKWRKKGFYSKAHNFVVYVNRSDQRIETFKSKQRIVDDTATFLYALVTDGGVR